jgi:hypothetical protein
MPPASLRIVLPLLLAVSGCSGASSVPKLPSAPADTASADPTTTSSEGDTASSSDSADSTDSADSGDPLPLLDVSPAGPWCPAPADALAFRDIATDMGLIDTADGMPQRKEAGPVAALDLDGDGLDELLVGHRTQGLVLHRNVGGRFEQQVLLDAPGLTGIALGDVDGDGDLDLWTGGYARRLWLLRNDGPGDDGWRFTDITEGSGLDVVPQRPQKTDATFGDFDGDGDLDLYVNRAGPPGTTDESLLDQLFRSNGDGTFEVVSDWLTTDQRQGVSWSAVWSDLDLDDDPDLFLANADQASAGPSLLLENSGPDGDAWQLTDRSDSCYCTDNFNPMGVSAGDFDHDGDFDLFLTNTASDQLLVNDGELGFVDVSRTIGDLDLPTSRHMTFGSVWTDIDNDGWPDLFVSSGPLADFPDPDLDTQPDRLLLNEGGARLTNRAADLGVDHPGIGRGVTRALLDDDGYPELVVIHLDGPSHIWKADCLDHRALVVELRQASGNTRAIGARVSLSFDDGPTQVQEVTAKAGWGGAMEPRAWFGLGTQTPATLTVRWPDGGEDTFAVPEDADGRVQIAR